MNRWAVYNQQGRIDSVYSGPEFEAYLQARGGLEVVPIADGLDDVTAYISGGAVQPKQPMPLIITNTPLLANGTDEAVISGIPEGAQVEWPDGQTDIVTGGEIRFSVDLAGTYTFRFTAVPYLDKEITIEAIAAT
jgi:hypothetical protein